MLIGELHGKPVLGAPGCARSPKENGFDWVLQRLMADIAVRKSDITKLGVGGLLMEIVQRGHLRDPNAGPQD
jgi:molybdenum cofactor cytidylyltransferase